jgi:hypothetical protein
MQIPIPDMQSILIGVDVYKDRKPKVTNRSTTTRVVSFVLVIWMTYLLEKWYVRSVLSMGN